MPAPNYRHDPRVHGTLFVNPHQGIVTTASAIIDAARRGAPGQRVSA